MNTTLTELKSKLLAIPQNEWFSAPIYKLFRQYNVEILDADNEDADDVTPMCAIDWAHSDRRTAIDLLFKSTEENPLTLSTGLRVFVN